MPHPPPNSNTQPEALHAYYRGPGLVDLQVNGYAGFDFNGEPGAWTLEALHRVRAAMRRRGVVAALPTLITDEPATMLARAGRYAALVEEDPVLAAFFPRLHVEGPFVAREDGPRGAHPREFCRTPEELRDFLPRLQDAARGRTGVVTLAPELPGALDLIEDAARQGIVVGIGHSDAAPDVIAAAVSAGASLSTHLGNGVRNLLPRTDNLLQAQLADDRLCASFIADGHHVPAFALKSFIRAKSTDRSILITDAMAAADAPPARYALGRLQIDVHAEGRVVLPGTDYLAGSALTLDRAVVNVARSGIATFEEAWQMASVNPARLLKLELADVEVAVTPGGFALAT